MNATSLHRYLVVGIAVNSFNYLTTLCLSSLGIDIAFASALGFFTGGILSFWLNLTYTFSIKSFISHRILPFFLLQILLLLAYSGLASWFHSFTASVFLAPFLALTIVVPVNYLAQKYYIFRA